RLFVDGGDDAAGVAVEAEGLPVVPDVAHDLADDLGDVDVGVGGDLTGHHHQAGREQRLARHPAARICGQDGVKDGVRHLVGHLVRVALGDRLRRERVAAHALAPKRWTTASRTMRATSRLPVRGTFCSLPSAASTFTWLVSCSKPAPGAVTSLATMTSRRLRRSLASASSRTADVSAANPTSTCPSGLRSPRAARMSGVGSSTSSGTPSAFLIFEGATALGRKSATAAAMITASAPAAAARVASSISAAVCTGTTVTVEGTHRSTVDTRVTPAPRRAASWASAYPWRPDERLPR